MNPLTLNGYARHRRAKRLPGGSIRAVVDAVAAGRIDVGPGQMILDPAAADAQWEARTDASKRHPARSNGHGSLADARRLESIERARGLRLANDLRAGRLVELAPIERRWGQYVVECRNRLLGIPARLKVTFPQLTPDDLAGIDRVIRDCLEELAGRRDYGDPSKRRDDPPRLEALAGAAPAAAETGSVTRGARKPGKSRRSAARQGRPTGTRSTAASEASPSVDDGGAA